MAHDNKRIMVKKYPSTIDVPVIQRTHRLTSTLSRRWSLSLLLRVPPPAWPAPQPAISFRPAARATSRIASLRCRRLYALLTTQTQRGPVVTANGDRERVRAAACG